MKTLFAALFLLVALPGASAAQTWRVAVDYCYNYWYLGDYEIHCDVNVSDSDGWVSFVGSATNPLLSPDGKRVAFLSFDALAPTSLIVANLEDGTQTTVTNGAFPVAWSADSQRMAFVSWTSTGTAALHIANADGTGLTQVPTGTAFRGYPTWSRDGRLAFVCEVEAGNRDICSINSDGTGFTRLTTSAAEDAYPAFSPDGSRIAFVTNQFTPGELAWELAILNGDGTVSRLGAGVYGGPVWSPDGSRIAFTPSGGGIGCEADGRICYFSSSAVNVDGTGLTWFAGGANPSWALSPRASSPSAEFTAACPAFACTFDASPSRGSIVSFAWRFGDGTTGAGLLPTHIYATLGSFTVELTVVDHTGARSSASHTVNVTNIPPVALFTATCTGLTCTLDGSSSRDPDGQIASYYWRFGDGVTGSGRVVSHTFADGGIHTVSLTVTDTNGAMATEGLSLTLNWPPVATFVTSCSGLECIFDGRDSADSDGAIVDYLWNFGDGSTSEFGGGGDSGKKVTHVYPATGTYRVVLTIRDNSNATATYSSTVTLPGVHIGDLDGASNPNRSSWSASVTVVVHDDAHRPVVNAAVTGSWSGSPGVSRSCTTSVSGACTITSDALPNSAGSSTTFNVSSVVAGAAFYDAARNHDVDGGTNGTTVTVRRR